MVARGHDICAGSLGKFFAGLVMAASVKTDLGKVGRALRFCGVLSGLHGNWVLNVPWRMGVASGNGMSTGSAPLL